MISTYVGENSNKLKGDLIIFLENGVQIRCIDRNIKDFVDYRSTAIYKLSENEIKYLRNHLITKIRFTVNYGSRGNYLSTAINKIPTILAYNNKDSPDYYFTTSDVKKLFLKDYSGEYTSNKTVFKNEVNPKQNFIEETRFNIALVFKNINDGMIIIQDPRIPDRPLFYRITGFVEEKEIDGYNMIIYNCVNDVTYIKNEAILFSNENGLSLMINNKKYMQAWYNLKLKSNE
ncbi:hypothetical protein KO494_11460 [Lacinutrix sp. C3R15]|uniref:hypothetical protein n=1 Tax=Flavobacteriaceae TaxID=49546 RepID=UPI001C08B422|nr:MULTISPECIES: hypothetical protein [Flavobacteriaceae]MBU2940153.1 hypothetical protein [Lacinutrix sp. C3R15]MDO6623470.1 hypothetical protein [Oceanihabitans sp. 1_MG-2023]